jgi:hypothetical protein
VSSFKVKKKTVANETYSRLSCEVEKDFVWLDVCRSTVVRIGMTDIDDDFGEVNLKSIPVSVSIALDKKELARLEKWIKKARVEIDKHKHK